MAVLMMAMPAVASQDTFRAFVGDKGRALMAIGEIQSALRISNLQNKSIGEAAILDLDGRWRSQIGTASTPDIEKMIAEPASEK